MQQLQFEASWDKALSAQDRNYIENIFADTKYQNRSGVICSPIREAINHKEALLVSVLVHNFTDQPLIFENVRLLYRIEENVIAEMVFNLPQLVVPNEVSMPWTFIFPKGSYTLKTYFKNGLLEIV